MAMLADSRPRPRLSLGRDLAIDLGTANTRIHSRGSGVVLDEPSVVAMRGNDVVAVGQDAKDMMGRAPDEFEVVQPIRHSVIHHYDATERMLRYFVQVAHGRSLISRPRLVINVPAHLTGVEQRAVRDAGYAAGARQVYLIQTALAAAIGAGLPIHESQAQFVVSIGAGGTEVAVIASGAVVVGTSLRTGAADLDDAIRDYLIDHFDIRVGAVTAEQIKITLGSAVPVDGLPTMAVPGQDARTGLPKQIELSASHVRKALQKPLEDLLLALRRVLDAAPPEVAGDLIRAGLVLVGGGALVRGLPELSVVTGAGRCADNIASVRRLLLIEPAF
jgi:rod shape-determining protein MreB